jgi:hypothetical protein
MAVTMKSAIFWGVMPCVSCKNRRFRGTYCLHHKVGKNQRTRNKVLLRSVLQLLVTAKVPSLLIHSTQLMEAVLSLKHRFIQTPHDVVSQNTALFIIYWIMFQRFHILNLNVRQL